MATRAWFLGESRKRFKRENIMLQTCNIAYECFDPWGVKVDEGPARTVDIRGRGALVEIPRGVPLDASMVLWVRGAFHMLLAKGNVVHSRPAPNGTYHVGVQVTEVVESSWNVTR
jgi:hypothetical protein